MKIFKAATVLALVLPRLQHWPQIIPRDGEPQLDAAANDD
jgi:hypothetical protein